jgi:hypothetical protein
LNSSYVMFEYNYTHKYKLTDKKGNKKSAIKIAPLLLLSLEFLLWFQ